MHEVPTALQTVLNQYNVLSLAVCYDDIPWAANAFYVYDDSEQRLILMSSLDTRHGEMLSVNRQVAGTITPQFDDIRQIHGVQFLGVARQLDTPGLAAPALQRYYQRFPLAAGMTAAVWDIHLVRLKLTDNRLGFGTKVQWNRHAGRVIPGASALHTPLTTSSL
ncbi:pyridoxamine 5'-phosphate oxidase family protein [Stenotrophomonas sp.]|uniref:pyridoxamine 5'-phosphate oxidase family protein n=1 Tax=Stenotrophomonas sp. TaxID=69392 RepID=UPI0028A29E1C|nr:pyridoxamine 5'-phosphate oxidase family protein [Stenotrophomonas sp.]